MSIALDQLPGPSGASLGRLNQFHKDPLMLLRSLYREFGPRVRFRMGPWTFLLLADAASAGSVLSRHLPHYRKGPGLDPTNPLIGQGLLLAEGEAWVRQRRLQAPVFRPANVRAMIPTLHQVIGEFSEGLLSGQVIDLQESMLRLSLEMALRLLFGTDEALDPQRISQDIQWLMAHFYHRSRSIWRVPYHWPLFNRHYHIKAQRLYRLIDHLAVSERPYELIWSHIQKEKPAFYHQALSLLLAGHETTGHALSWAFDLLARHQEVEPYVIGEAAQEGVPTPESHPWTHAVFREALRLYPPAWLLSRVNDDVVDIANITVPPHTFILISPWLLHRDPAIFSEPDAFRPSRWIKNAPPPPYAYIPFGAGPRGCIGEHLAASEALMTLSYLTSRWRMDPRGEFSIFPGLTLSARGSMPMTVTAR